MAPPAFAACGLPGAWAHRPSWTVLDTDFQDGQHFLNALRAWQHHPGRPRMLHYVGITAVAPDCTAVHDLPQALAPHWVDLRPGFHRILLEHGQVSLTLCVGDVSAMLGEHVFQTDTLLARAPADKWEVQALARRCKRGTRFWVAAPSAGPMGNEHQSEKVAQLQSAGFQLDPTDIPTTAITGRFDPRWHISTSRTPSHHVQPVPARCAIVGAGITGASVAHALALRGWEVTVFDGQAQAACGASGLPVGLAVPHVSADDNPRSRMSRSGTHLLQQHARHLLLRGQDWEPSGVMERLPEGDSLWHARACWIKPAALVHAWLAHPGIRFVGASRVARLHHTDGLWHVFGPQDVHLGRFEAVVVANAMGCADLLAAVPTDGAAGLALQDKLAALQAVHGTLSQGRFTQEIAGLPAKPVNGDGCFISLDDTTGTQWFAGSTFETDAALAADGALQHAANMERLRHLLQIPGTDLIAALNRAPVSLWSSTRCVTHDRLPLVGPVDAAAGPGLWLSVGMGSRGLSFSALCAELLVARMGAEPLPLEFSLSLSLDANRPRRRPSAPDKH
ncbi:FAD-dependent oxidoreductase [Rhodoferax sp. AJA081-3]|uniref:FAD-dependent oxidoreductase n=1 Tax=Rhodoferax sp. AJA081-3 TaxID=2752316 RepID=UPI001ADFC7A8|nr:FAD-dependent oxidoreductase [Rhodoferax sp. AJA081-3]QTN28755.1 FAD-dependent oxidoreductase [Rhodoferax sp. AJA081-3]